jgi:antitoxin component YwqK of YwqJK toxin-antitoxin module
MKKKLTFIVLMSVCYLNGFGQKLTASDLTNLCEKKDWNEVNKTLLSKGWFYYNSQKGENEKYNTITWAYNKDRNNDEAEAWFSLFTFENIPNKIEYTKSANEREYLLFINTLYANRFNLNATGFDEEQKVSYYAKKGYKLDLGYGNFAEDGSKGYIVTLIKKGGIFDLKIPEKKDYYENGQKVKLTMSNGKRNGPFKVYDSIGNLKITGNFINDKEDGKFIEYENGKKQFEYWKKNDLKNGEYIYYSYDDSNKLHLKNYGQYINDEENGTWKLFHLYDSKEKLMQHTNYVKGSKEGKFLEVRNDSLIVGNYKDDDLHGSYKIYIDKNRTSNGGFVNTNTSKLSLITTGQYIEGEKTGCWKTYERTTGLLKSEGNYLKDYKTGEWKLYYSNVVKQKGKPKKNQSELLETTHFSEGMRNGKSTRYFQMSKKYPCDELDKNGVKLDSCIKQTYTKILEKAYFINDKLTGPFELRDSINQIISKGTYLNGLKEKEWTIRNPETGLIEKGNFKADKKEGKWISYNQNNQVVVESNFRYDELDGEYIEYNNLNSFKNIKKFNSGLLKELIVYDSLGLSITTKFKINEYGSEHFKCIKTDYYLDNSITSQEYWVDEEYEIQHESFEDDFNWKTDNKSDENAGYPDGEYTYLDTNGKSLVTGTYFKENKIDKWTYFYYDKDLKIEVNYVDNVLKDELYSKLNGELYSGEFTNSIENNKVKTVSEIKKGLRNGRTTFIDLNTNKVIEEQIYKNGILKKG